LAGGECLGLRGPPLQGSVG